jgi:hypothetical protein
MYTSSNLQEGYAMHHVDATFVTKKILFFFWMPITKGRYESLKSDFVQGGKTIDWNIGMIEEPKMFGFGRIGLSHFSGDMKVQGDFISYTMKGSYSQFKDIWPKIMKDYPNIKEAYHFYQTDPTVTKEEDNITVIAFR